MVIACYFRQIVVTNNLTNKRFARNIVRKPWDTADNERVFVIVFTFKTDTDDTMEFVMTVTRSCEREKSVVFGFYFSQIVRKTFAGATGSMILSHGCWMWMRRSL